MMYSKKLQFLLLVILLFGASCTDQDTEIIYPMKVNYYDHGAERAAEIVVYENATKYQAEVVQLKDAVAPLYDNATISRKIFVEGGVDIRPYERIFAYMPNCTYRIDFKNYSHPKYNGLAWVQLDRITIFDKNMQHNDDKTSVLAHEFGHMIMACNDIKIESVKEKEEYAHERCIEIMAKIGKPCTDGMQ